MKVAQNMHLIMLLRNGHLEVVEWLYYYVGVGFTDAMFALVVGNRHLHIVKWLFKHVSKRWHSANSAIDIAIFNGDIEMVKWLMDIVIVVQAYKQLMLLLYWDTMNL